MIDIFISTNPSFYLFGYFIWAPNFSIMFEAVWLICDGTAGYARDIVPSLKGSLSLPLRLHHPSFSGHIGGHSHTSIFFLGACT
jgi:hypothetical protein